MDCLRSLFLFGLLDRLAGVFFCACHRFGVHLRCYVSWRSVPVRSCVVIALSSGYSFYVVDAHAILKRAAEVLKCCWVGRRVVLCLASVDRTFTSVGSTVSVCSSLFQLLFALTVVLVECRGTSGHEQVVELLALFY